MKARNILINIIALILILAFLVLAFKLMGVVTHSLSQGSQDFGYVISRHHGFVQK